MPRGYSDVWIIVLTLSKLEHFVSFMNCIKIIVEWETGRGK